MVDACVAALLLTTDGNLVLQERDDSPTIEFPGHYALVAGRVESGETVTRAIVRELEEELSTIAGTPVVVSVPLYIGCDRRVDRPWTEYVFAAVVHNAPHDLLVREGRGLALVAPHELEGGRPIAPHHLRYLQNFIGGGSARQVRKSDRGTLELTEGAHMSSIADYVARSELGHEKNYDALEGGDGFVVVDGDTVGASIHTHCDAAYIALLTFKQDEPRGNHFHRRKIEYMTVLTGRLKCDLRLVDDPDVSETMELRSGEMLRILPGCIHTYTALDADVLALEFSPQEYEASDTIVVE